MDIQFSKGKWDIGGPEQRNLAPLRDLRDTLFHKYLDAKTSWVDADDKFSLEPIDLIYKKDGSIDKNYTYSWIHLDVREFKTVYLEDKYFCKNGSELNGQSIILLAKDGGHANTCSCLKGVAAVEAPSKTTTGCYCTDELTEEILQEVAPHATKANVIKFVDGFNHVDDRLENVKKGFEHLYKSCKNDTEKNTEKI